MNLKVRKSVFRILVGISAFLLLFLLFVIIGAIFCRPKAALPDTLLWRTGMVFFSVGNTWESAVVRSFTGLMNMEVSDSTPSHCGIVILKEGNPFLVHASTTAGHIVVETPVEYIENNGSYCLYTKPHRCQIDTLKLKSQIDSLLGIPVPFDYDFNHFDNKSLYCTELVVTLFELNGCTSLSTLRKQHFIYPQDILNILETSK